MEKYLQQALASLKIQIKIVIIWEHYQKKLLVLEGGSDFKIKMVKLLFMI